MDFIFPIDVVLLVVTLLFIFLLSFIVIRGSQKLRVHRIFIFLSFVETLWLLVNYFSLSFYFIGISLFLIRLSLFFGVLVADLLFMFVYSIAFFDKRLLNRNIFFINILTLIAAFLTLTPFVFRTVDISSGYPRPIPAAGISIFVAYVILITALSIFVLIFRLVKTKEKIIKRQLFFVVIGMCLMIFFVMGSVFIPVVFFGNSTFVPLIPLYTLIFLLFTTYAIIKHHLFDIKVIATELAVFFLFIMLLLNALASTTTVHLVFNIFLLLGVVGIGLALIRSVIAEANRREATAQLAEHIQKVNTKLKEVDRLKSEFLSIAAHQLRTPLSTIKGFVSLLKEGAYGRLPMRSQDVLGKVYTSNERLVRLVNEFLTIAHIEKGKVDYQFDDVDVVALARSVADELEHHASEKKINLSLDNKLSQTKKVKADQEKLHHVIYNFVDNAIKYTEKGCVTVIVEEDGKGVVVRVCDEGIGFGEEEQPNFFKKFYRGGNVKGINVGGTGLGLYVAREFIKGHKGKVWGKSQGPGKGAEFGFWIPKI